MYSSLTHAPHSFYYKRRREALRSPLTQKWLFFFFQYKQNNVQARARILIRGPHLFTKVAIYSFREKMRCVLTQKMVFFSQNYICGPRDRYTHYFVRTIGSWAACVVNNVVKICWQSLCIISCKISIHVFKNFTRNFIIINNHGVRFDETI